MQTFNAGGREQSLLRTAKYRPDLIEKAKQSGSLTDEDLDYLSQIADELEEKIEIHSVIFAHNIF